jgi:hypothetical protein
VRFNPLYVLSREVKKIFQAAKWQALLQIITQSDHHYRDSIDAVIGGADESNQHLCELWRQGILQSITPATLAQGHVEPQLPFHNISILHHPKSI